MQKTLKGSTDKRAGERFGCCAVRVSGLGASLGKDYRGYRGPRRVRRVGEIPGPPAPGIGRAEIETTPANVRGSGLDGKIFKKHAHAPFCARWIDRKSNVVVLPGLSISSPNTSGLV